MIRERDISSRRKSVRSSPRQYDVFGTEDLNTMHLEVLYQRLPLRLLASFPHFPLSKYFLFFLRMCVVYPHLYLFLGFSYLALDHI